MHVLCVKVFSYLSLQLPQIECSELAMLLSMRTKMS
jgi:hypothetical protein